MTSVTRREGFRYGAYMFGYWLALLLFSAVLIAAGSSLIYFEFADVWSLSDLQGEALAVFGGVVALLGVVVLGSGQFGLAYKLVSDAVDTGSGADTPSESVPEATEPEPEPDLEAGSEPSSATPPSASTSFPGTDEATAEGGTGFSSRSGSPTEREPAAGQSTAEATASPNEAGASTTGQYRQPGDEPDAATAPAATDSATRPDVATTPDTATTEAATTETTTVDTASTADASVDSTTQGSPGPSSADGQPSATATGDRGEQSEPEGDAPDHESPEEVASESGIAEELGFKQGEEPVVSGSSDEPEPTGADSATTDAGTSRDETLESGSGAGSDATLAAGGRGGEDAGDPLTPAGGSGGEPLAPESDSGGEPSTGAESGSDAGDELTPGGGSAGENEPLEADEWETGEEKIAEDEAGVADDHRDGGEGGTGAADLSGGGAADLGDTNDLVDVPSGADAEPKQAVDDADQADVESAVESVDADPPADEPDDAAADADQPADASDESE